MRWFLNVGEGWRGWRGLRSGFERLLLVGVDGVEKCRRGGWGGAYCPNWARPSLTNTHVKL